MIIIVSKNASALVFRVLDAKGGAATSIACKPAITLSLDSFGAIASGAFDVILGPAAAICIVINPTPLADDTISGYNVQYFTLENPAPAALVALARTNPSMLSRGRIFYNNSNGKCENEDCATDTKFGGESSPDRANADHIHRRSKGGNNSNENGPNLCQQCNMKKGNRLDPKSPPPKKIF